MQSGHNPNNHAELSPALDDGIASLCWSPTANYLVATCWNNTACLWEIQSAFHSAAKQQVKLGAPVLSSCWSKDGRAVYVGSCDNKVTAWDYNTNQTQLIGQHDAPVRHTYYADAHNMVVTGSWDKTVRFWDPRTPGPAKHTATHDERIHTMHVRDNLMVVGTASRTVYVYDLTQPQNVLQKYTCTLQHQLRTSSIFPNKMGYAMGSIEGRVCVQYFSDEHKANNFAFKCHRQAPKEVYSINVIDFHPYGTFATCGADGSANFWDKDSRQRLKQFQRGTIPIACGKFNTPGNMFAYAVCYDWSKGAQGYNAQQKSYILVHDVPDVEVKPRPKKK